MTFLEQFKQDVSTFDATEIIYYLFCASDANMIKKIREYTVFSNFFIFCDSLKRPGLKKINSETNMYNALIKSGFKEISESKFLIEDIISIKPFESAMKKRYGTEYSSHLASRTNRYKPFLTRYILENKNSKVLQYHSVYEPITFLELLMELKKDVNYKKGFGLVIKDVDTWSGAVNILQPNRRLVKTVDPSFIISPKRFWFSTNYYNSYFKNWKTNYTEPVPMDNELFIAFNKKNSKEKQEEFDDYRKMRDVGMIST